MCRAHTLSVEALSRLNKWQKAVPDNIFFCESSFYNDVISFTKAAYATSVIFGVDEIDEGIRGILFSCERELSATLPTMRESKWLLANIKAIHNKSYAREGYAKKAWGEALYHQTIRNSLLGDAHSMMHNGNYLLSDSVTIPDADAKMTNELNTICMGLRIDSEKKIEKKEKLAPFPNVPLITGFVKSCFNDQK
jgi:hypothetical protein